MKFISLDYRACRAFAEVFGEDSVVHGLLNQSSTQGLDIFITAGNSFGFMDGGIDQAVLDTWGYDLQSLVIGQIQKEFGGFLPVGSSVMVSTKDISLVYTPTMPYPKQLDSPEELKSIYYAFLSSMQCLKNNGYPLLVTDVLCSMFGVGTGGVDCEKAAQLMQLAMNHHQASYPCNWEEVMHRMKELERIIYN